jgi:hypothetical protein
MSEPVVSPSVGATSRYVHRPVADKLNRAMPHVRSMLTAMRDETETRRWPTVRPRFEGSRTLPRSAPAFISTHTATASVRAANPTTSSGSGITSPLPGFFTMRPLPCTAQPWQTLPPDRAEPEGRSAWIQDGCGPSRSNRRFEARSPWLCRRL